MPFFHVSIVKRKSIQKLGQVSIKISEFSFFFFFLFVECEEKSVVKKTVWRGEVTRKILLEGWVDL